MGTTVHQGWLDTLRALQVAGLATGLFPATLADRLGSRAPRPPEPHALTALLIDYYRGDGDVEAGLARLRRDRFVAVRSEDGATARQIVARLRLACAEVGPLGLIDDCERGLVLRTQAAQEPLSPELLEIERYVIDGASYEQRTVTIRALVAVTNRLLSRRAIPHRFVPLALSDRVEAYAAVAPADLLVLEGAGLLDEPLELVRSLTCWDRGPLVVYQAARRVA